MISQPGLLYPQQAIRAADPEVPSSPCADSKVGRPGWARLKEEQLVGLCVGLLLLLLLFTHLRPAQSRKQRDADLLEVSGVT